MKTKTLLFVPLAAAPLAAALASAAHAEDQFPMAGSLEASPEDANLPRLLLSAGGGVTGFVKRDVRVFIRSGGYWNVRAALPLQRFVTLDGAYTGSAQGIKHDGSADVTLIGNGLEANMRVGYPFELGAVTLEPFAVAGFGLTWYKFTGSEDARPDLLGSSDIVGVIPLGIGAAVRWNHYFVDARATYRYTLEDGSLVFSASLADPDRTYIPLDHWQIGAVAGYAF